MQKYPKEPILQSSQANEQKILRQNKVIRVQGFEKAIYKRQCQRPENLMLLSSLNEMRRKMPVRQIIWVDKQHEQLMEMEIFNIVAVNLLKQVYSYIDYFKSSNLNFIVIGSNKLSDQQLKSLYQKQEVKFVILYCLNRELAEQRTEPYKHKIVNIVTAKSSFIKSIWDCLKRLSNNKQRVQMDQIAKLLNGSQTSYNKVKLSLLRALQLGNQKQALKDFIIFLRFMGKYNPQIQAFQKQNSEAKHNEHLNIISQYAKKTFFFELINQTIKIIDCPSQSGWIRFPLTKLFQAVKNLFMKSKSTKHIVYSGIFTSKKQLNQLAQNQGKVFQTMCFLQATTDQKLSKSLAVNTQLIIQLNDQFHKSNGFLLIQDKKKGVQFDVLVNLGNYFKIQKVQPGQITQVYMTQVEAQEGQKSRTFFLQEVAKGQGRTLYQVNKRLAKLYYFHRLTIQHNPNSITYYQLSLIEFELAEFQQANKHALKSLEIEKQSLQGKDHPSLSSTYLLLSRIKQGLGNYQKAKQHVLKSLELLIKAFGKKHLRLTSSYLHLSLVQRKLKNYVQAKMYAKTALEIQIETLGKLNPSLESTYNQLWLIESEQGETQKVQIYASLKKQIIQTNKNK